MKGTALEHSDVVFMYVPENKDRYAEYGAVMSAWGGANSLEDVRALEQRGVYPVGGMWCLTAGARELHESSELREATVRDIAGEPIAVPWLLDHVYEGTPSWWGCGNHPTYRAHLRKAVCNAMSGGAKGLHIDDHLSTADPTNSAGGCFCDYCMKAFRKWLIDNSTDELLQAADVATFEDFNYRELVKRYAATREEYKRIQRQIPLHKEYLDFQLRRAAENIVQLRKLAEEIVEQPITLSANTCLPNLNHTVVTPYVTHLVGEVDHRAKDGTAGLISAVKAYRMAEALGKPMAATATGWDWAYIKEAGADKLVGLWIALSYACGQRLMVPDHMWCFTPEKGTHWYDGPSSLFAPIYRFICTNAQLFNGFETAGPLAVNLPQQLNLDTYQGREAFAASLDEGEPHPLSCHSGKVWILPRRNAEGTLIIHLLNLNYDSTTDSFAPEFDIKVDLPLSMVDSLSKGTVPRGRIFSYDSPRIDAAVTTTDTALSIRIPELRLWSVIELM